MNALSRREEDALLKSTKAHALKECDPIVREFAECTKDRSISLLWACKGKLRELQDCMKKFTSPERMDLLRAEYVRQRDEAEEMSKATKKS